MRPKLVAIGEAMIEIAAESHQTATWTFAGDTFNCAAAVAANQDDFDVEFFSGLADTGHGNAFKNFAANHQVGLNFCDAVPGREMGLYWITTDGQDRSFSYWRQESAARHTLRSGIKLPVLNDVDVVLLSGITLALAEDKAGDLIDDLAHIRSSGIRVAFDTNYRDSLWPDLQTAQATILACLAQADVVVSSSDDVRALFDCTPAAFISDHKKCPSDEVVVTDGPSDVVFRSGETPGRSTPPKAQVVDTTGAGDAFFGAFLASRLSSHSCLDSVNFAAYSAAVAVGVPGAIQYLSSKGYPQGPLPGSPLPSTTSPRKGMP